MISQVHRGGVIRPQRGLALIFFLLVAGGLFWWWAYESTDPAYGSFEGAVTATWDPDGRNMTLEREFAYIDPRGRRWLAPTGTVINGASIPRIFWSVIGGPFEGKFRSASVVHDAAVDAQVCTWQDAHRMFYDACRCARVGAGKAQTMYWAVYHFGPRWHEVKESRIGDDGREFVVTQIVKEKPPQPDEDIVKKAARYFEKQRLSPDEIEECWPAVENLIQML